MNKDAKLSEHFTLGEMTKTKVKRLSNVPTHAAVLNLKNLCENWLELLRYAVILLDVADETKREFDELLVERSPEGGYWLHFAVRPSTEHSRASSPTRSLSGAAPNRRKVRIIQT